MLIATHTYIYILHLNNAVIACQPGYYKTKVSNDNCAKCPNGMQTFRNFTTHCYCTSYSIVKDQKCVSK